MAVLASCRLARLGVGGWLRRGWHGPGSLEVRVSEHLRNTFRLAAPMAGYAGWLADGLALTALRRIYSPIYSAFKRSLGPGSLEACVSEHLRNTFRLAAPCGRLGWLAAGWLGWAGLAGWTGSEHLRNTFGAPPGTSKPRVPARHKVRQPLAVQNVR